MRYRKPALLYDDQLNLLIGRGLDCQDRSRALEWLKRIGYYRLSAYFIPFKNSGTDTFKAGIELDHVVDLYKFDCNLRLLILQALDRIEIGVRAVITYHFAHDLGVFGYADASNFHPGYKHFELMSTLGKEEKKSNEIFVQHYRSKYTSERELPVWMATELMTFGVLSRMFASSRASLRNKISKEFGQPEVVFTSWLHALAASRNVCAHHSRLWNRELSVKPMLPFGWKAAGIQNKRLYVIALVIQSLLDQISPNSKWKDRLRAHLDAYPNVDLIAMHFPANWQTQKPWA